MSIFHPTSTKSLNDLPTISIDETNYKQIAILAINSVTGQIFRIPAEQIANFFSVSYSDMQVNPAEKIIIGRYDSGPGPIQTISIGNNIILNSETGLLDSNLTISGPAGGVLEGELPNPTLKDNTIELSNFVEISPMCVLGNPTADPGQIQEITFGPEFDLDAETKTVSLLTSMDKIVETGFVVVHKHDGRDFTAVHSTIYICNSDLDITINANDVAIWQSGKQFIVINRGTGNISISLANEYLQMTTEDINLDSIHIMADGLGGYLVL